MRSCLPRKSTLLVDSLLHRQPLGARALRAIADHQQPRRNLLLHPIENLDDVRHALHRAEVRQMHQNLFVGLAYSERCSMHLRRALVEIAVHEVGNHLDRRLHVEDLDGPLLQIIRNRGDAVALVDGEARDRQVRRIGAYQRDVGAVQRGDVRQPAAFARVIAAQHLARQHRAHRMRNGVVHVQQIEIVNLGDLGHARRQRQIVRRIFEQRITRDLNLVIVNVGLRLGQPDGLRIGDEVDFMAALRQLQSQARWRPRRCRRRWDNR